jgi:hypothetical protein
VTVNARCVEKAWWQARWQGISESSTLKDHQAFDAVRAAAQISGVFV